MGQNYAPEKKDSLLDITMFYISPQTISNDTISSIVRALLNTHVDRKVLMDFDNLWHLKPNEAPKADMILSRLSEAGVCLLSGEKENLVSIPVDFNTNNMLPTNMACISKTIASDILYTLKYSITLDQKGIVVTFNTPECFVEYNTSLLNALEFELPVPTKDSFIEIYETLMSRHLKGVDKIKLVKFDRCIEWIQLQRYWFSQVDKMKNKKAKIITVNFGN